MKFELNDYHRNISNEELLDDVIKTANNIGKNTLMADEYSALGKYHSSTFIRRFGSWKKVLELCHLETRGHSFKCDFSDEEIIQDIKRVAKLYEKSTLTREEYNVYGICHSSTLSKYYGSWNSVLELAGMKVNLNRNFSDVEMFEEIERVWVLLGRQPTTTDIKKGISKFSLNSYARRFGGWRGALEAFVAYINSDEMDEDVLIDKNDIVLREPKIKHKTNRDINLRLRFKVLQRDHFKCCACGASPAKDSNVELHVDHIYPWSKGGETTIDNLRTLCSKCNLGKGDMIIETENIEA